MGRLLRARSVWVLETGFKKLFSKIKTVNLITYIREMRIRSVIKFEKQYYENEKRKMRSVK